MRGKEAYPTKLVYFPEV